VTQACGTGACAVVVAAKLLGKIPRTTAGDGLVKVTLPGGQLFIDFNLDESVSGLVSSCDTLMRSVYIPYSLVLKCLVRLNLFTRE
jgi:diaminopimelate epimerase